jgi:hypothetical protein
MNRSRIWLVATGLYLVINVGGAIYALAEGEMMHAGLHIVLLVPGVFLLRHLAAKRDALRDSGTHDFERSAEPDEFTDRLRGLEHSVEAVALEVERIGEGQRFMTRMYAENEDAQASPQRDATPVESKPREPDSSS